MAPARSGSSDSSESRLRIQGWVAASSAACLVLMCPSQGVSMILAL